MDLGLTYRALADGQIGFLKFTPLVDNRNEFKPYQEVPVFNSASPRRWLGIGHTCRTYMFRPWRARAIRAQMGTSIKEGNDG
jgi:hypothetical protein